MPKYYASQFLKFIGNALKENAVILPRMAAFSRSCSMADFATGMPLKFRENRLYNRDVWCYTIKDVLCAD